MPGCPICGAAHTACRGAAPDPEHVIDYGGTMASNLYTADRRLYLDAAGNVVEADDPARLSLLVAEGGTMLMARAQELGLVNEPEAEAPAAPEMAAPAEAEAAPDTKAKAPAANKAQAPAENK